MDKLIIHNKPFITNLCKRFLDLEITESNFKVGYYDEDDDLYLSVNGQEYIIRFDPYNEMYQLLHKNKAGCNRNSHSYHKELSELSLVTLINKLSTRHNPKDLVKKSSRIEDLLLNKTNSTKGKPID